MKQNGQQISDITIASFRLSQAGLAPLGRPSFAQWLECGQFIKNAEQSVQFWIGDWLIYGEQTYGKTDYERAVAETGLSNQTLRIYKHVAAALPLSLRRNNLSFHHHKEVASLSPAMQIHLLERAEAGRWPLFMLKKEKRRLRLEAARSPSSAAASTLLLGEAAQVLSSLPDKSVDLLLTDPPQETAHLAGLETTLPILLKKLKENSHVYLFTDWKTYPGLMSLVRRFLTVKNLLVYEQHYAAEETPYRHSYGFLLFAATGEGRHLNGRRDASLLPFTAAAPGSLAHSEDKPLPLLEYLIGKSSQPGEVICDPFMGTGAVCLAAKNTNRRYIGMEKNKVWYDNACSRLA